VTVRVVELAGPDHPQTTPSGKDESFSTPSAVTRKLSSTRRPPPPPPNIPGVKEHNLPPAARGDQEVVLDPEAAAALPVDPRLDREHHALLDRARSRLVRVGRLVGASAHAVRDRVARLARVAGLGDAVADQAVELGKARAGAAVLERALVDREQLPLALGVVVAPLAGAEVLRVIAPVAVGADPDLEERRL